MTAEVEHCPKCSLVYQVPGPDEDHERICQPPLTTPGSVPDFFWPIYERRSWRYEELLPYEYYCLWRSWQAR